MKNYFDQPLFVFEMANNHMGIVKHGLKIIHELHDVSKSFKFNFAFKFQYRQLDTFIHPDFKSRFDFKYVKRFSETRLKKEEFLELKKELDKFGFISICTPFDEESVDLIEEQNFDIIKVASCSFTDWPLLERIVKSNKPIIASTAGIALDDIDKVVSFFEHRGCNLSLMHCVAEYPTRNKNLQLNQISLLKTRYPNIRVGYSTHEKPDNMDSIKIAIAKGASIFEKHVGVATDNVSLNDYSATPQQVQLWLQSAQEAMEMCGVTEGRYVFTDDELNSLHGLRRGVFAKNKIKAEERVSLDNVFRAIPLHANQLTANDLSKYSEFSSITDIQANEPILLSNVRKLDVREKVYEVVQRVKKLLKDSNVVIPGKAELEISHHYGIDRFDEFGLTMITVVNRDYCKKLLIVLPGQKHPEQFHEQKDETFHVLHGDILINLDGQEEIHPAGDVIVVDKGVHHAFTSKVGAVIEEISSTHYKDDSFYADPEIANNKNRKTLLTYWMD